MEDSRLGGLYERDKRPFDDDHVSDKGGERGVLRGNRN